MPSVQAVISRKGSQVLTITPQSSALEASVLMNKHKIGALVVVENGRVCGIFTERDVLQRIVADRQDPAKTFVASVMTRDIVTCRPETELDESRTIFMARRIRHLPVLNEEGKLLGMISIGDVNAWDLNGQECKIAALEEYLYGQTI
ncbi:MAG: CBS domain-containing protein [Algisphaera sp.]